MPIDAQQGINSSKALLKAAMSQGGSAEDGGYQQLPEDDVTGTLGRRGPPQSHHARFRTASRVHVNRSSAELRVLQGGFRLGTEPCANGVAILLRETDVV